MEVTKEWIQSEFPLHHLIWENRVEELAAKLEDKGFPAAEHLEKLDPRGRTPLLLAVCLGHQEAAQELLKHNASAQFEHCSGWNVLHEAVCRAEPDLVRLILEYKDAQKQSKRSSMVPDLLRRLADAPDFYVEIKFELASWMPFIGSMVPGNMHRVYKMGSNVRVDSCILEESEGPDWSNAVTLIFQGLGDSVRVLEIYHSSRKGYSNVILSNQHQVVTPGSRAYERTISRRMSRPAMIAYVDLEKIEFERNKTVWGWGSDKTEMVNNYECKVFSASNVEFVTKLRTEHLSEAEKNQAATGSKNQATLQSILSAFGTTETTETTQGASAASHGATSLNFDELTMEHYFDRDYDLHGRDIGRSKEIRTKINKFKAQVWLCEDYPVNLQEQIMPIIDIMSLSNTMFSKLKQFIQMQIPAGFPVKIEIPLFHVVNARVTFHNIFATESAVSGVSYIKEESGRLTCVLEEEIFDPPPQYSIKSVSNLGPINPSDDDLFSWTMPDEENQFFEPDIPGGKMVDIYEALNAPRSFTKDSNHTTPDSDAEEQLLQRAIEESLVLARMQENPDWQPSATGLGIPSVSVSSDQTAIARANSMDELQAVLDLSRREIEEESRLRMEEEEALRKVLELSLTEQ